MCQANLPHFNNIALVCHQCPFQIKIVFQPLKNPCYPLLEYILLRLISEINISTRTRDATTNSFLPNVNVSWSLGSDPHRQGYSKMISYTRFSPFTIIWCMYVNNTFKRGGLVAKELAFLLPTQRPSSGVCFPKLPSYIELPQQLTMRKVLKWLIPSNTG